MLLLAHLDPLLLPLQHDTASHNIVLGNRPDTDTGHGDGLVLFAVTVLSGVLQGQTIELQFTDETSTSCSACYLRMLHVWRFYQLLACVPEIT
jgi:hypothetical protein